MATFARLLAQLIAAASVFLLAVDAAEMAFGSALPVLIGMGLGLFILFRPFAPSQAWGRCLLTLFISGVTLLLMERYESGLAFYGGLILTWMLWRGGAQQ